MGFETMETYIRKGKNMAAQYIATRSLLDLCKVKERKQVEHVCMRWWEQAGIDLAGERDTETRAAEEDEDGLD